MAGISHDKDRKVVPIWRSSKGALKHAEVIGLGTLFPDDEPRITEEVKLLNDQWLENRTMPFAADFLAAGFVSGHKILIQDVAKFVNNESASPSIKRIARFVLGIQDFEDQTIYTVEDYQNPQLTIGAEVKILKKCVIRNPNNALAWADLGRCYLCLGQSKKAEHALVVASKIAPNSRYILRALSRFYLHANELDLAHDILVNHPRTSVDPWLMASEIAVAHANDVTSQSVSKGKRFLSKNKFSPRDMAELNSAIGTLMIDDPGGRRKGRQMIEASLINPTETVVAQAAWIDRNRTKISSDFTLGDQSSEASAWQFANDQKWDEAIESSKKWFSVQPFSSRPSTLASYWSAVANLDFEESERFAKAGLSANPKDFTLQNNLAFALAEQGKGSEALSVLSDINPENLNDGDKLVYQATSGLAHFKSGNHELGHLLYGKAIEGALSDKNLPTAVNALVWYLIEIKESNQSIDEYLPQLDTLLDKADIPELNRAVEKLKQT